MFTQLLDEVDSIIKRDPAARSRLEVLACYPGFHALVFHRLAHGLWRWKLYLIARVISNLARWLTGIEIHPAAQIGRRFFIDHGMGVVIGATAVIGDDVHIYHGVTLGGRTLEDIARHPVVMDGVIIGAGATLLGRITVGSYARIGANALVLSNVPCGKTVLGVPARVVESGKARDDFLPYGTAGKPECDSATCEQLVMELSEQVAELSRRVAALEFSCNEHHVHHTPDTPSNIIQHSK